MNISENITKYLQLKETKSAKLKELSDLTEEYYTSLAELQDERIKAFEDEVIPKFEELFKNFMEMKSNIPSYFGGCGMDAPLFCEMKENDDINVFSDGTAKKSDGAKSPVAFSSETIDIRGGGVIDFHLETKDDTRVGNLIRIRYKIQDDIIKLDKNDPINIITRDKSDNLSFLKDEETMMKINTFINSANDKMLQYILENSRNLNSLINEIDNDIASVKENIENIKNQEEIDREW